jgi:hypothetical protein
MRLEWSFCGRQLRTELQADVCQYKIIYNSRRRRLVRGW